MFRPIFDLPTGVIGYSAVGKISRDDYTKVLIPEIEARTKEGGKLRFLLVAGPDFEGYEMDALVGDSMFGMRHFFDFEKIAFVSDNPAFRSLIEAFGMMMPAGVKSFPMSDLDKAKAWLVG
ncbi:MAG: STAS/SEC14 domain-containing protein [Bauldia sp.]